MISSLYEYIADSDNFTLRDSLTLIDQIKHHPSAEVVLISGVCPSESGQLGDYYWATQSFHLFTSKAWAPEFVLEIEIAVEIIDEASLSYFLEATRFFNNTWEIKPSFAANTLTFEAISPGVLRLEEAPIKAADSDPRQITIPIKDIRVIRNDPSGKNSVEFNFHNGILEDSSDSI
ncbi:hypothetical protein [uncultured Umboniibacter sp.]|uniref:hypothetical protein n=1 Tax=uncultured Umboniibacter sp. TaxID=1798917 RepID=UPI0026101838|nr:hypothetical protein [uncultured Umboniibacter sp.]